MWISLVRQEKRREGGVQPHIMITLWGKCSKHCVALQGMQEGRGGGDPWPVGVSSNWMVRRAELMLYKSGAEVIC